MRRMTAGTDDPEERGAPRGLYAAALLAMTRPQDLL